MISDIHPSEAFVWVWLPSAVSPIVAGRIFRHGHVFAFNYGRSYLARADALPLYLPELVLGRGAILPTQGLTIAGCLRDAAPDAWGRRVILNRNPGTAAPGAKIEETDELSFMLLSGSDRAGNIDFQASASTYVAREAGSCDLADLVDAAERIEAGRELPPALEEAIMHGSSIGGARPKAIVTDGGRSFIAKFSSSGDLRDVVRGEFIAMRLARRVGLDVATVELRHAAGKDVLLVERFDRIVEDGGRGRRAMVSALTMLGLDEMMARYASYADLADLIRQRFRSPATHLRELFARLVFNVLVGNTDDHARNHAAFWDGAMLALTPAYDICPQARSGQTASQAMLIADHERTSQIATCLLTAPRFMLSAEEALAIVEAQIRCIIASWNEVCDEAGLAPAQRKRMWRTQILNPFVFQGAPPALVMLEPG